MTRTPDDRDNRLLYFNGLRPDGSYLMDPLAPEELGRRLADLGRRWQTPAVEDPRGSDDPTRAPRYGVDPKRLEDTGWAVVWAPGLDPLARRALDPLCDLRSEQAGQLYREIDYRRGESVETFLGRLGAPNGIADPRRLPYYVLLVGSPDEIPFSFQCALDQVYGVGRIHFDQPEDYASYARSVEDAEVGRRRRRREIAFFAPENENDRATRRTRRDLAEPLADYVEEVRPAWKVDRCVGAAATRQRCIELLGRGDGPALLFSAGHGLGIDDCDDPTLLERQGALITCEWPGPGHPISVDHTCAAADLEDGADAGGLIAFCFACYSVGTPELDAFWRERGERRRLAHRPFSSALAKRLTSLPAGGALAVIGHVDRAWTTAFDRAALAGDPPRQRAVFECVMEALLDGVPVGGAMEYFGQLDGDLAGELNNRWKLKERRPASLDLAAFANLRIAQEDAHHFVVFGDPAVRLSVRGMG